MKQMCNQGKKKRKKVVILLSILLYSSQPDKENQSDELCSGPVWDILHITSLFIICYFVIF